MWWGAVVVQGIDFNGGSLRIATPRGGGGTVDTVMYEDIRGHNMNYLLEFNMWCGARDAATQLHSLTRYLSSCLVHLLSSRCTPPGAGTSARPRLGGRSRHRATCPPTPHPHPRCRTSSYATCRFDSLSPPLCLPRRLPHCVSINRLSHCVSLTVCLPLCLPRRLPHCVSINRLSYCVAHVCSSPQVTGVSSGVGIVEGLPESPFRLVTLENIHVDTDLPWVCRQTLRTCDWAGGG
jgi:hypothetical protein